MYIGKLKSEYRISKYETISNDQNSNDRNKIMAWMKAKNGAVFVIEQFEFGVCFGFRISDFEFADKLKKNSQKSCLVPR